MKLYEQFQYKLRNYLYAKDREKRNKEQYPNVKAPNTNKDSVANDFMGMLDEMDAYLEEILNEYKFGKKR